MKNTQSSGFFSSDGPSEEELDEILPDYFLASHRYRSQQFLKMIAFATISMILLTNLNESFLATTSQIISPLSSSFWWFCIVSGSLCMMLSLYAYAGIVSQQTRQWNNTKFSELLQLCISLAASVSVFELAILQQSIWRVTIAIMLFLSVERSLKNQLLCTIAGVVFTFILLARTLSIHLNQFSQCLETVGIALLLALHILYKKYSRELNTIRLQAMKSSRKELNSVRQFYNDLLGLIPQGLTLLDSSQNIVFTNSRVTEILKCESSEIFSILMNLSNNNTAGRAGAATTTFGAKTDREFHTHSPHYSNDKLSNLCRNLGVQPQKRVSSGGAEFSHLQELYHHQHSNKNATSPIEAAALRNQTIRMLSVPQQIITRKSQPTSCLVAFNSDDTQDFHNNQHTFEQHDEEKASSLTCSGSPNFLLRKDINFESEMDSIKQHPTKNMFDLAKHTPRGLKKPIERAALSEITSVIDSSQCLGSNPFHNHEQTNFLSPIPCSTQRSEANQLLNSKQLNSGDYSDNSSLFDPSSRPISFSLYAKNLLKIPTISCSQLNNPQHEMIRTGTVGTGGTAAVAINTQSFTKPNISLLSVPIQSGFEEEIFQGSCLSRKLSPTISSNRVEYLDSNSSRIFIDKLSPIVNSNCSIDLKSHLISDLRPQLLDNRDRSRNNEDIGQVKSGDVIGFRNTSAFSAFHFNNPPLSADPFPTRSTPMKSLDEDKTKFHQSEKQKKSKRGSHISQKKTSAVSMPYIQIAAGMSKSNNLQHHSQQKHHFDEHLCESTPAQLAKSRKITEDIQAMTQFSSKPKTVSQSATSDLNSNCHTQSIHLPQNVQIDTAESITLKKCVITETETKDSSFKSLFQPKIIKQETRVKSLLRKLLTFNKGKTPVSLVSKLPLSVEEQHPTSKHEESSEPYTYNTQTLSSYPHQQQHQHQLLPSINSQIIPPRKELLLLPPPVDSQSNNFPECLTSLMAHNKEKIAQNPFLSQRVISKSPFISMQCPPLIEVENCQKKKSLTVQYNQDQISAIEGRKKMLTLQYPSAKRKLAAKKASAEATSKESESNLISPQPPLRSAERKESFFHQFQKDQNIGKQVACHL